MGSLLLCRIKTFPLSSILTSFLSHFLYTSALFAFVYGDICMVALIGPLAALIYNSSSLLCLSLGALIINLLSPAGGDILSYRSHMYSVWCMHLPIVFLQFPSGECHPRLPGPTCVLLTYTHVALSASVYSGTFFDGTACQVVAVVLLVCLGGWVGLGAPGRASLTGLFAVFFGAVLPWVCVFVCCIMVPYTALRLYLAASLAAARSSYLCIISSAVSMHVVSSTFAL